ncbi:hypothetical protein OIU77_024140 [Salix suchowensis]|uniref:Uncharacterized protein n=1 Tax=Salix suchowensis TaxID=1278906 RepID=A0ABQ8ZGF8_9ROSI|nr:hypothetical protein OIU77_024140 [Salix suchowensis]
MGSNLSPILNEQPVLLTIGFTSLSLLDPSDNVLCSEANPNCLNPLAGIDSQSMGGLRLHPQMTGIPGLRVGSHCEVTWSLATSFNEYQPQISTLTISKALDFRSMAQERD